jgi:hypothetical protein
MQEICYGATIATRNKHKGRLLLAFAALAMQTKGANACENNVAFDADSVPIGADNQCTACASHRIEDFQGPLVESN